VSVETAFDPSRNLIIVEGEISGPLGDTPLRLVLDTGAAASLVVPDIVDALGYSPRDAEVVTGVCSAVGKEQGYILRVARFSALGFTLPDVRIHVFDLADRYGIDGLIGLSFLRQFNYEIRSAEGRILVEKIAP
jgi:predicted aspartyl protease